MRSDDDEPLQPVENGDGRAFFGYLQSAQGHELASRVVTLIEEIKKATLDAGMEERRLNVRYTHRDRTIAVVAQGLVFLAALGVAAFLSYHDRFNATFGLLLGTLVGFFFGRRA